MKKKLSIFAVVAATALLVLALVAVAQALTPGHDPNAAAGLNSCPNGDWFHNGKPVDTGIDLYDAADNVYVPNATQDGCLTQQELSRVQPGLGTIMIEVGYRAWVGNYAAKGGNWGLAAYEFEEMAEAMESGAITRPGNSNALLGFMDDAGLPAVQAVTGDHTHGGATGSNGTHNLTDFNSAYATMINDCNACHVGKGHSEVHYGLSSDVPADLSLGVGEDLHLKADGARFATYTDYQDHILTVDFTISNIGKDTASSTQITGAVNAPSSIGIADDETLPKTVGTGTINGGTSADFSLRYKNVGSDGSVFYTTVHATTQNNGVTYSYPAS